MEFVYSTSFCLFRAATKETVTERIWISVTVHMITYIVHKDAINGGGLIEVILLLLYLPKETGNMSSRLAAPVMVFSSLCVPIVIILSSS